MKVKFKLFGKKASKFMVFVFYCSQSRSVGTSTCLRTDSELALFKNILEMQNEQLV